MHPHQYVLKRAQRGQPLSLLALFAVVSIFVLLFLSTSSKLFSSTPAPRTAAAAAAVDDDDASTAARADGSFLYFAYASDLLESRLKAGGGKSAVKVGVGRVKKRKFAFSQESRVWRGGVADVVPSASSKDEVWGVVYRLAKDDLPSLDKQKGVDKADPLYERIAVVVEMEDGGQAMEAITYSIVESKRLPFGAAPSPQYKDCLVRGAIEVGLPERYVESIQRVKDNGSTYKRKNVC